MPELSGNEQRPIVLAVGPDSVSVDGQQVFVPLDADPWQVGLDAAADRAQELGLALPAPVVAIGPEGDSWHLSVQAAAAAPADSDEDGPIVWEAHPTPPPAQWQRERVRGRSRRVLAAGLGTVAAVALAAAAWVSIAAPAPPGHRGTAVAAPRVTPSVRPDPSAASPAPSSPAPSPARRAAHRRRHARAPGGLGGAAPANQSTAVPTAPAPTPLCTYYDPSGSAYLEPCGQPPT